MTIDQIKQSLSILTVLKHYNLSIDKNNRVLCPWHPDKTPSLQIYPKTNTWTCFSSNCSAGSGDQIEMIQKIEKSTKHQAIQTAKKMLGVSTTKPRNQHKAPDYPTLFLQLIKGYHSSPQAQQYAHKRELHDIEMGYNTGNTWTSMRQCLIFPLKDQQGNIVSLYGRSIKNTTTKNYRHYYNTGRRGLYPGYPTPQTRKLILTESIIDAASLHQLGYHTLALFGTENLNQEHLQAIDRIQNLQEIILFLDGDSAGHTASQEYQKLLTQRYPHVSTSILKTDSGHDVNSLLVTYGAEYLQHLLEPQTSQDQTQESEPQFTLDTSNPDLLRFTYKFEGQDNKTLLTEVLGGIRIHGLDRLRVTLKTTDSTDDLGLRHSLDLYHHKQLQDWIDRLADHYHIHRQQVHQCLGQLITELEAYRLSKIESLKPRDKKTQKLTTDQQQQAIQYLKAQNLITRTLHDIRNSGIVGEQHNAMIAYLAYTSRKRSKPLHVMFLGSSGSGKTHLQEQISKFIPDSEKIEITSLSDNAFYYFNRKELSHKLICIEDLDGAQNALYPLRELQSKSQISKTVATKDTKGHIKTVHLVVEGPVCVSGCTTQVRIYEDNANRCILLYVDQSSDQSQRIMEHQKKLSAGLIDKAQQTKSTQILQYVQQILKPIHVINPYALYIDLPPEVFKPRRTLSLLLNFIETVTFYHQYQRKVHHHKGRAYIQTTLQDIQLSFQLIKEVLFSKSDELSKACRNFFENLKEIVPPEQSFYTKQIRQKLRIPPSTLKRHIHELNRYGRLRIVSGNQYRGYEYQITSYDDSQCLKNSIDQKLDAIIAKIKSKTPQISGPVAH